MVRRLLVLLSVLSLAFPMAANAQDPAVESFERAPIQGAVDPQVLPAGIDDSRLVNVMVQLDGDPVAVRQAQSRAKLTKAEKDAIKAELKARQDAIKDDIAARGGTVLSQLQSAYNGMRVQIARADAASLASLPNVVAVRALQVQTIENAVAVPYIGGPQVWENLGFHGEGIKVAVIDTGIDYTHANFGGAGTVKAFQQADRGDTRADRSGFFGPNAPKVKGGFDFVGDAYDASSDDPKLTVPHPDPNPLDCNGHGSHVAGSAAGFGVNANGTTYTGSYDETTHNNAFRIGPGVAPKAELYALRVFGCEGSTDVTVEAIDWAVDHDMDVINMSLGSPFGRSDDPSAEASTNAAGAGVIVVASAGNEGEAGMGFPGAYAPVISVAASGWTGEWTTPTSNWWRTLDVADPTAARDFYITDFSSREKAGQDLDVAAPGSWVVGPFQNQSGNLSYFFLGGTSMASPHVAGIAALMMQKDATLRQAQVETILESTAIALPAGCRKVIDPNVGPTEFCWGADATGAGLATADRALAAVGGATVSAKRK